MEKKEEDAITEVIKNALDIADKFWLESGHDLEEEAKKQALLVESLESIAMDSNIPSNLPNHDSINQYHSQNAEFIAIVADMRKSTEHAKTIITGIEPLHRIFLETSALLPAMEKIINFENGQVTEYLGDGVLGFFNYNQPEDIYKAYNAAKNIIVDMRNILNQILSERYKLPQDIHIGVGIAKSQTIIYAAGLPNRKHPKAFGSCIYDATKLATGTNIIGLTQEIKALWPKSKNGKIQILKASDKFKIPNVYCIKPEE
jgi:hypothetical protein